MYGCEWDDETGKAKGYDQYGYDGEDFLTLNLETESWIASKQQAFITKTRWDDKAQIAFYENYYTTACPEWLKKYVNYGRSSLMKTELPSVSLLQKTSSSSVTCHATGFYPNRAEMFWRKDGEEIHDGVLKGEIVPNNDGTFQMTVDIDLSSAPSEDWTKYECVFQLSGEKDLFTKLEKAKIRNNDVNVSSTTMIIPIIVAVVVLAAIAVIGFVLYKKKNAKRPPSPVENPEVQQQMLPTA
ncbi:major histocompatibility complex class I-related gene protein-like [Poecilia reticulata]|uniref:major histocompatibility complex class I-related gene protein-like n=1 Tax=Poecilia reticulata TaxID=8081 RepID=UPI0004A42F30|nr:PREDICTED: major histocompatibility complex class I-related gene protein-like [Poecilia reticulata]